VSKRPTVPLAFYMHERYSGAMATIQIRNVPERVHRAYRVRAAAAGMSLQEYLLAELCRSAELRTPAELVAEVEERLRTDGPDGLATASAAAQVRADRDSH
jgi:plasmid stability protein